MNVTEAPTLLALQANIWSALEEIKGYDINEATKYLLQTHGVRIGDVDRPKLAMAHRPFDLLVHLQMILKLQQLYVQSPTSPHILGSDSQDPPIGPEQDNLLGPILLHEMLRLLVEFLLHLAEPAGGRRGPLAADSDIYWQVVCTIHAAIRIAYLHPRRTESSPELIEIAGSIGVILEHPTLSEEALSEERIGLIICAELIKRAPHAQRSEEPSLFDINIHLYPLDNSTIVGKVDEVMMEYQNEWVDSYWTIYDILCGVSGAILQHGAHKSTSQCDFDAILTKIAERLFNQRDLVAGKTLDPQVGLSLQKLSSHAASLRDQVLRQQGRLGDAGGLAQTPEKEQRELSSLKSFRSWLMNWQNTTGQGAEDVSRDGADAYEPEPSRPTLALVGTPRHPELTRSISRDGTGSQTRYLTPPPSAGAESLARPSTTNSTPAASAAPSDEILHNRGEATEGAPGGARRSWISWFRRFSCFS